MRLKPFLIRKRFDENVSNVDKAGKTRRIRDSMRDSTRGIFHLDMANVATLHTSQFRESVLSK